MAVILSARIAHKTIKPIERKGVTPMSEIGKVRPLKDHVILYVDESLNSHSAVELLKNVGIKPYITNGTVEPFEEKPLAIYAGGIYQGLEDIRGLVSLLSFWSAQSIDRSLFAGTGAE